MNRFGGLEGEFHTEGYRAHGGVRVTVDVNLALTGVDALTCREECDVVGGGIEASGAEFGVTDEVARQGVAEGDVVDREVGYRLC